MKIKYVYLALLALILVGCSTNNVIVNKKLSSLSIQNKKIAVLPLRRNTIKGLNSETVVEELKEYRKKTKHYGFVPIYNTKRVKKGAVAKKKIEKTEKKVLPVRKYPESFELYGTKYTNFISKHGMEKLEEEYDFDENSGMYYLKPLPEEKEITEVREDKNTKEDSETATEDLDDAEAEIAIKDDEKNEEPQSIYYDNDSSDNEDYVAEKFFKSMNEQVKESKKLVFSGISLSFDEFINNFENKNFFELKPIAELKKDGNKVSEKIESFLPKSIKLPKKEYLQSKQFDPHIVLYVLKLQMGPVYTQSAAPATGVGMGVGGGVSVGFSVSSSSKNYDNTYTYIVYDYDTNSVIAYGEKTISEGATVFGVLFSKSWKNIFEKDLERLLEDVLIFKRKY